MRLKQIKYDCDISGYGDVVPPRFGGSAKYDYLALGKKFLRMVVEQFPFSGKISDNPGGNAVPGDVTFVASKDTQEVFISIQHLWGRPAVLWRIGARKFATDGVNMWLEDPETTPGDVAQSILRALND